MERAGLCYKPKRLERIFVSNEATNNVTDHWPLLAAGRTRFSRLFRPLNFKRCAFRKSQACHRVRWQQSLYLPKVECRNPTIHRHDALPCRQHSGQTILINHPQIRSSFLNLAFSIPSTNDLAKSLPAFKKYEHHSYTASRFSFRSELSLQCKRNSPVTQFSINVMRMQVACHCWQSERELPDSVLKMSRTPGWKEQKDARESSEMSKDELWRP